MNKMLSLLIWVDSQLLKLYPRRFQALFGNEIKAHLEIVLASAISKGIFFGIKRFGIELVNLATSAVQEHMYEWEKKKVMEPMNEKKNRVLGWMRFLAYGISILFTGNLLLLTLYNLFAIRAWTNLAERVFSLFVIPVMAIALIYTLRNETSGGKFMMGWSIVLGLSALIVFFMDTHTSTLMAVFIAIALTTPNLGLGWLFTKFGRRKQPVS